MPRKPKYARGEIMSAVDCDFVLVKGNLTDEEFQAVLEKQEYWLPFDLKIEHGWRRCEQRGDCGNDYDFILQPTKPHACGAFEATWVAW